MQKAASDPARCLQPKSLGRRMLDHWQIYLLVAPAVIYIFLFNYLPMVGLQIAFRDYRASKGIWGSQWVGLKYFIKFFNYPNCWKIIRNTLVLSLYSLATFPLSIISTALVLLPKEASISNPLSLTSWIIRFIGADSGLTTATMRSADTMLPKPMLISLIRGPHSIFWICSRIFSISDLRSTTTWAISEF